MSGPRDDFLQALSYQVKAEAINNYLRERLILEEEIKEYRGDLNAYRALADQVRDMRDHLACLLIAPRNFSRFFSLLGFAQPPLARLGHGDLLGKGPACPVGIWPKGLTHKRRYASVVFQTYAGLQKLTVSGGESAERLMALAREINEDIRTFHRNFDLMTIIQFLKSLDIDMRSKMKFLGDNFNGTELSELERNMMFRFLDPAADGIRSWPKLPTPQEARERAEGFVAEIFGQEREKLLPVLR